jgi:histone-lysine N-methyltransferase SETMAR
MDRKDQRVCIKFCVKNDKTEAEIYEMLQKAYGKASLSRYIVCEWVRCFQKDHDLIKDDLWSNKYSACFSDINLDKVRQKIVEDQRISIKEIADEICISQESCQSIVSINLGMKRVAGKFVPRFLSDDQKSIRYDICLELKHRAEVDPLFLDSIITGDEMWIYSYNSDGKSLFEHTWKSPNERWVKNLRLARYSTKILLIIFFDSQGLIHQEFLTQNQAVNTAYYKEILIRLREKIRSKRPQLFRSRTWFLHYDNAFSHNALSIREFLAEKKIPVLPHPSYSPDLVPSNFFLFPKIKFFLKGKTFYDANTIKKNTLTHLQTLTLQDFQNCFQNLQDRWGKCMNAKGEYIDSDKNIS